MTTIQNLKKQMESFSTTEQQITPPTSSFSTKSPLIKPDQQTFEETHKLAYSHGLELIYKLENVDLKSIKPIAESRTIPIKAVENSQKVFISSVDEQLQFDFGDEFRGWIDAFISQEPIQFLGLSRHAEKCLQDHGKTVLADLIEANLHGFIFFKGMGQGHVDEIRQKLHQYIDGRPLTHCHRIDFASWVRSVAGSFERKKIYAAMEKYKLNDLFSLTPAESVEVRRLTLEKKQEWIREFEIFLKESQKSQFVLSNMLKIVNVFFKPWMRNRMGIATKGEIFERLERISVNSEIALQALSFFADIFFQGKFPIGESLYPIEKELYCVDLKHIQSFQAIVDNALTYFYKPNVIYPLPILISYLQREFALDWGDFTEGFIEKVLRHSSTFRVRKGFLGDLEIRLA